MKPTQTLYGGGAPPPTRRGPIPVYHPGQTMPCTGPMCPGGGGFTTFRPGGPGQAAPGIAILGNPYGAPTAQPPAGGSGYKGAGTPAQYQPPRNVYGAGGVQPPTLGPAQFGLAPGQVAPPGTVPVNYFPVAQSAPPGSQQTSPPPTFGYVPAAQAPVGNNPKLVMAPGGQLVFEYPAAFYG